MCTAFAFRTRRCLIVSDELKMSISGLKVSWGCGGVSGR